MCAALQPKNQKKPWQYVGSNCRASVFDMHVAVYVSAVCNHSQGGYFPPNRRRSIVFRVSFQQTNNKQTLAQCGGNYSRHRDRQGTPRPSRTTPD